MEIPEMLKDIPSEHIERITKYFLKEWDKYWDDIAQKIDVKCGRCGKKYGNWQIPDKYWKMLPKEWWVKSLCYKCYLSILNYERGLEISWLKVQKRMEE